MAGDLELDLVDGIESLLDNSLLRTERMSEGEPRFGILETMREYALERLAERGDGEAVRRRHASFYLRLAEDAEPALLGPEQVRWARKLDCERDNLRAALTWAAESGETDVGLRTAGALWRFWQMRAADVEGREHLDRLLASGTGAPSSRALAQAKAAGLAYYQGDFGAVHRYYDASLPVFRELGDDLSTLGCLDHLTLTTLAEGDADAARALSEHVLEMARRMRESVERDVRPVPSRHRAHGPGRARRRAACARGEPCGERASSETSAASDSGRRLWAGPPSSNTTTRGLASCSSKASASTAASTTRGESWAPSRASRWSPWKNTTTNRARRLLHESLELLRKSGHTIARRRFSICSAGSRPPRSRNRRAACLYGSGKRHSRSQWRRMVRGRGLARPHPAHRSPPLTARRGGVRREVGARTAMTLDQSLTYALKEESASDLIPPLSAQRWS